MDEAFVDEAMQPVEERYRDAFENITGQEGHCTICLQDFHSTESLHRIKACNHVFHPNCLRSWLERETRCPLCRTPIYAGYVPLNRRRAALEGAAAIGAAAAMSAAQRIAEADVPAAYVTRSVANARRNVADRVAASARTAVVIVADMLVHVEQSFPPEEEFEDDMRPSSREESEDETRSSSREEREDETRSSSREDPEDETRSSSLDRS